MSAVVQSSFPQPTPRLRFKNILLATDFGSASLPAQTYAILLARMFGAHLFVLHVDEGPGVAGRNDNGSPRTLKIKSADMDFRRVEKLLSGAGIPFTFLVKRGEVRETLSRAAEEHAIDLIVLGTHARHGLSYLLFGSIAENFGRSSTRPVITVGPRALTASESPLKTILYATDFSEESRLALPYAVSLAQEFRADLTVFHAAPAVEREAQNHEQLEACLLNQLETLAPQRSFPWCHVTHKIAFGPITEEILRQAQRQAADLIVLGLHNSVRFTSHFPERLAYRIMCAAPCPVLSVLPSTTELRDAQQLIGFPEKTSSFN